MKKGERKKSNGFKLKVNRSKEVNEQKIAAYLFDRSGQFLEYEIVEKNEVSLSKSYEGKRVFIGPINDALVKEKISIRTMKRINAFEHSLNVNSLLNHEVFIPNDYFHNWLFCFCHVTGRVLDRNGFPVCGAKVHVCEVDRFPNWINRLTDLEIYRLKDDIIRVKDLPPTKFPPVGPGPDPVPFNENLELFGSSLFNDSSIKNDRIGNSIPTDFVNSLRHSNVHHLRIALIANRKFFFPYFCFWPYWWHRYRCDEMFEVTTDDNGRFSRYTFYNCNGDKPDLYFWVEYEIDGVLERVYHPPVLCNTYWDYQCGTEVTIRIKDSRVFGCNYDPDLPGCEVHILSIGSSVSIANINNDEGGFMQGLIDDSSPFGGILEPRVWFSKTSLLLKNIKHYRWSYRSLNSVDWISIVNPVSRRYVMINGDASTHEVYPLGPQSVGSTPNLFEIRPVDAPIGSAGWSDAKVFGRSDVASAFFNTSDKVEGLVSGKYEMKFELFDGLGNVVNWDEKNIEVKIPVPYASLSGGVEVEEAPRHKILDGTGKMIAFRMVVHVDNDPVEAKIFPVVHDNVTNCGFLEYENSEDSVGISFRANHPKNFATIDFDIFRGSAGSISVVSMNVVKVGETNTVYNVDSNNKYEHDFIISDLLEGSCDNAAFAQKLVVRPTATDGYNRVVPIAEDNVAFALAKKITTT